MVLNLVMYPSSKRPHECVFHWRLSLEGIYCLKIRGAYFQIGFFQGGIGGLIFEGLWYFTNKNVWFGHQSSWKTTPLLEWLMKLIVWFSLVRSVSCSINWWSIIDISIYFELTVQFAVHCSLSHLVLQLFDWLMKQSIIDMNFFCKIDDTVQCFLITIPVEKNHYLFVWINKLCSGISCQHVNHCYLSPLIYVNQQVTQLAVVLVNQINPFGANFLKSHHCTTCNKLNNIQSYISPNYH